MHCVSRFSNLEYVKSCRVQITPQSIFSETLEIVGCVVDRIHERHAEQHRAARLQYASNFLQGGLRIPDMFQDFQTHDRIDARVKAQRQTRGISEYVWVVDAYSPVLVIGRSRPMYWTPSRQCGSSQRSAQPTSSTSATQSRLAAALRALAVRVAIVDERASGERSRRSFSFGASACSQFCDVRVFYHSKDQLLQVGATIS